MGFRGPDPSAKPFGVVLVTLTFQLADFHSLSNGRFRRFSTPSANAKPQMKKASQPTTIRAPPAAFRVKELELLKFLSCGCRAQISSTALRFISSLTSI